MRLYVMRHGVAIDRLDPDCPPDPERPLTPDGSARARQALHGLVSLGVTMDRIFSSPYARSLQTAELAAEALGVPRLQLETTPLLLPGADLAELVQGMQQLRVKAVLYVGHAPEVDLLIALLCGQPSPFTSLKKAGIAHLERKPGVDRARLVALLEPKVLRQLGRP